MLNTTIPTLEIKTSGIDLSAVETIMITIRQKDFIVIKGNSDIETDNDVISVFLEKEESKRLKEDGGASITVLATDYEGETKNARIIWAKFGSRTSGDSGGSGGGGTGEPTTVTVGVAGTITGEPGTGAYVENIGDPVNVKLKFTIPRGKQGTPGKDGTDGKDGLNGNDGASPHIGSDGNWYIGSVDTGVKAKGTDGKDGINGADGITPHIGANNNWFIGLTDTGIRARGVDGEDGFSPIITENPGNGDDIYKLDIVTETGSFTTPNLKGQKGDMPKDYLPLTGGMLTRTDRSILGFNNAGENQTDCLLNFFINGKQFSQMVLRKMSDGTMFQIWDVGQEIPELFTVRPDFITYKRKKLITEETTPFKFGIESGQYGYYRNDTGEFVPFEGRG